MLFYLNSKANNDDISSILEDKVDIKQFTNEINILNTKLNDLQKDFNKKISNYALAKDISSFQLTLEQKVNLTDITELLDAKADKDAMYQALQKKANKVETETLLNTKLDKNELVSLNAIINQKADLIDIEKLTTNSLNKVDKKSFDELKDKVISKADVNDFKLLSEAIQDIKNTIGKRVDDIDQDLDRLIENIKTQFQSLNVVINSLENNKIDFQTFEKMNNILMKKVDIDKIDNLFTSLKTELFDSLQSHYNEMVSSKKKFEDKLTDKVNAYSTEIKTTLNEINEIKNGVTSFISEKQIEKDKLLQTTKTVVNNSLNQFHDEITSLKEDLQNFTKIFTTQLKTKVNESTLNDYINQINNLLVNKSDLTVVEKYNVQLSEEFNNNINKATQDLRNELSRKVTSNEIVQLLNDKVDKNIMNSKVDLSDFEKLNHNINELYKELKDKIDINVFASTIKQTNTNIDDIKEQISNKANVKDILSLLKTKANIDDVNKALTTIHNDLETKNSIEEFTNAMDNQALINDTLCNENCIGRWFWKRGKVKNGKVVPWEVQGVNTAPDIYIWEIDKTFINVVTGGLYEINLGFYAEKKPTIQIMVNNEVIISAVNSASYVVHQSGGRLKGIGRSSYGNITGLTLVDYLMLPDQAKISVSYVGDEGGVGFIGLKKM